MNNFLGILGHFSNIIFGLQTRSFVNTRRHILSEFNSLPNLETIFIVHQKK